jgi:hypothetical protein
MGAAPSTADWADAGDALVPLQSAIAAPRNPLRAGSWGVIGKSSAARWSRRDEAGRCAEPARRYVSKPLFLNI